MKVPSLPAQSVILKRSACIIILLSSLIALYYAYQWYQNRYVRPFASQAVLFSGDWLKLPATLAGPGKVRLVHFWDPSCPCNVGNQQHLAELLQRFSAEVEFYVVQKPATNGQLAGPLSALTPIQLSQSHALPASPAVAVWDRQGQLSYFGPYSEGAVCSAENSFIEPILQAVLDNRPVRATHQLASGCLCDWSMPTSATDPDKKAR